MRAFRRLRDLLLVRALPVVPRRNSLGAHRQALLRRYTRGRGSGGIRRLIHLRSSAARARRPFDPRETRAGARGRWASTGLDIDVRSDRVLMTNAKEVLDALHGDNAQEWWMASAYAVKRWPAAAVREIIRLAREAPQEDQRYCAIYCLGAIRQPATAAALLTIYQDQSQPPRVRGKAAEHLAYQTPRHSRERQRWIAAFLAGLNDPAPEVRFWSLFGLHHHPAPPPRAPASSRWPPPTARSATWARWFAPRPSGFRLRGTTSRLSPASSPAPASAPRHSPAPPPTPSSAAPSNSRPRKSATASADRSAPSTSAARPSSPKVSTASRSSPTPPPTPRLSRFEKPAASNKRTTSPAAISTARVSRTRCASVGSTGPASAASTTRLPAKTPLARDSTTSPGIPKFPSQSPNAPSPRATSSAATAGRHLPPGNAAQPSFPIDTPRSSATMQISG